MSSPSRPLSPHLQVYRWQITMTLSILHRASGVVLALGAFALAGWLLALAGDGEAYGRFAAIAATLPGRSIAIVLSAALIYHFLNGIRHLVWDTGRALDIPQVYAGGYLVVTLTVILTAGFWLLAGGAA